MMTSIDLPKKYNVKAVFTCCTIVDALTLTTRPWKGFTGARARRSSPLIVMRGNSLGECHVEGNGPRYA